MAQSQQITPDTLPGGFSQWDTPKATSAPNMLPPDFKGFDSPASSSAPPSPPPEPQGNPLVRFLKAGASKYLGATLNAGPTTSTPATYGTPEWQQAEQEMYQRYKSGQPLPGISDYIKASSLSNVPANALRDLKLLNPIDMQKFQSGDVAGGLGSSLMNILLIRQLFKTRLPEGGSPNDYAEQVQPLSGYTKAQPRQLALPAAPLELGPSSLTETPQGVLPAASRITPQGKVQYLTRPLNPGESPAVPKDVNTPFQSAFIDHLQEMMNRQTETESPFQAADRRMAEYAKSPYDRATAPKVERSGPIVKTGSDITPRVPISDADMQNLLMQSLQMIKARAGRK